MTEFEKALTVLLSKVVDGFVSLSSVTQLTAGASQETYRVVCTTSAEDVTLALRRAQPTAESDSSVGSIGLDTEAALLQLAHQAGIPEPAVVHILEEGDELGSGFLMEWLQGETLGQRIVKVEELAQLRPRLAFLCGEALARVHALDFNAETIRGALPTVSPEKLIDETWAQYQALDVPVPMIDYTWRWLKSNLPTQSRTTLVHGDFRNGNLMVSPSGIEAVLDWELAHIGDPVRDLGWLCVNSWRFGRSELAVGGFGELEDLLAGYESVSGIAVPQEEVHFWEVFGSFWWAMATLLMANAWRRGDTPSLERPVIGRRSSEAQMDCVNLLIPGAFELPDTGRSVHEGTQLPMPAELLEGVAKFLKEDVAVTDDPHKGFLARVAANSLGIAQRELLCGSQLANSEEQRLQTLLESDENLDALRWSLVHQLRGKLPLDTPGLAEHLRQTVAAQLAIDQPRYSALKFQAQI
ncbi:MAG: phosphotransferase family protein [Halioglobus sp.]